MIGIVTVEGHNKKYFSGENLKSTRAVHLFLPRSMLSLFFGENMKWFHHEVDSMHSEKLSALIAEFGFEGYGRYWRIMEIVAERMDGTGRYWVEYPTTLWLQKLAVRRPLFVRYLLVISQLFDIKTITTGLLLRIEIPNLLKWQDNYTKDLEEKRKKLLSKERERERDIEKNKTHTLDSQKTGNSSVCEQVENSPSENPKLPTQKKQKTLEEIEREKWFEEDWQSYPRKAGNKNKAKLIYLRTVKSEEKRKLFQEKIQAYILSVQDPQFLKHGETYFRNWENLEIAPPIENNDGVKFFDMEAAILADMQESKRREELRGEK